MYFATWMLCVGLAFIPRDSFDSFPASSRLDCWRQRRRMSIRNIFQCYSVARDRRLLDQTTASSIGQRKRSVLRTSVTTWPTIARQSSKVRIDVIKKKANERRRSRELGMNHPPTPRQQSLRGPVKKVRKQKQKKRVPSL